MSYDNIALFDLDGTLVDFDTAMFRDLYAIASPEDPYISDISFPYPEYIKNRRAMIMRQPGWWRTLDELAVGFDVLCACLDIGFDIHVLTKGPKKNPNAAKEKIEWFERHVLPVAPDAKITISGDKGLVYGKVLVDDWPSYVEGWLEHRVRGLVVMPWHSYNASVKHPNVIHYNGTNISDVRARLEEAYARQPKQ